MPRRKALNIAILTTQSNERLDKHSQINAFIRLLKLSMRHNDSANLLIIKWILADNKFCLAVHSLTARVFEG